MFKRLLPIVVGGLLICLTGCTYFGASKAQIKSTKLIVEELDLVKHRQQESAANVEAARKALAADAARTLNSEVAGKELELAAQNLPKPTPDQLIEINARLTLALSKSEADRAKAEDLYKTKLHDFQALQDAQDVLVKKHQSLEAELAKSDAEAKSRAALTASIIRTLMIAGVVAAVGAVLAFRFFPSLTLPAAILSAVFFGLAWMAATIEPWMVYTAVGLVAGAFALFAVYSHREKRVADATVGALGEIRTESAQLWDEKLAPKMKEWVGESKSWLGKHIDSKAEALNVK